ncbi:type II toxin-antitoxin system RelE/ParE family toxin [Proteiniphilum acetatigenes]|uniref:type II toxin-antitoxin system RelE/ParE family toxin n=1 Tax=Proteiniphilum acetatigenes TaxID=294710 RepID=UPI00035DC130|nr:Plasmid stabilization system protein ParE [Porphyromonadaceae bacterium KH3CP3RA]
MGSYKLRWSEESIRNLEDILDYLHENWSEKVITDFKENLNKQLDLICRFPFIFPRSEYQKRLRKAVLSKQTTIFYEVKNNNILIAYIFDNKQNIARIK